MQTQFVTKKGFEVVRTWGLTVTVTAKYPTARTKCA